MATQPLVDKISFEEYLERESAADFKSEYRSGEVFAMSGGSSVHARLSAQMIGLLLRTTAHRCQVFTSDLKIYASIVNECMYPDVSIACDKLQFHPGRKDVILNPSLVVEVLSPSTRGYDLGLKTSFYRSIKSLTTIFLVDSERRYVQRQTRRDDAWTLEEFTNEEQIVWSFDSKIIRMIDIYEGIELAQSQDSATE